MCPLTQVLTVPEIAEIWGVTQSAVWYHLYRGHFRWRDTLSGTALVERESVAAYWGKPPDIRLLVNEPINRRNRR